MAIQTMVLDPGAVVYTDDQIVGKINTAAAQITRAACVAAAARPIVDAEVTGAKLSATASQVNLDAMADLDRKYIKTAAAAGQFKVVSIQRDATGKLEAKYDDTAV